MFFRLNKFTEIFRMLTLASSALIFMFYTLKLFWAGRIDFAGEKVIEALSI